MRRATCEVLHLARIVRVTHLVNETEVVSDCLSTSYLALRTAPFRFTGTACGSRQDRRRIHGLADLLGMSEPQAEALRFCQ